MVIFTVAEKTNSMDDILYILLLIAWGVYSAYRSQKKKAANLVKQSAHKAADEGVGADPVIKGSVVAEPVKKLEELWFDEARSVLGIDELDEVKPVEEKSDNDFREFVARQNEKRELDKINRQIKTYNKSSIEQPGGNEELNDEFDVRKAIIYAAILERPYA